MEVARHSETSHLEMLSVDAVRRGPVDDDWDRRVPCRPVGPKSPAAGMTIYQYLIVSAEDIPIVITQQTIVHPGGIRTRKIQWSFGIRCATAHAALTLVTDAEVVRRAKTLT